MRRARSFDELWNVLPNDQVAECERLFAEATEETLWMLKGGSPEHWEAFVLLIEALEHATRTLEFVLHSRSLLGLPLDRRVSTNLLEIDKHLHALPIEPGTRLLRLCLIQLVKDLKQTVVFDSPEAGTVPLLRGLVVMHVDAGSLRLPEPGPIDVFISYKHKAYKTPAVDLCSALESLNVRCWLDQHQMPPADDNPWERGALIRVLETAVHNARCTAFFESYNEGHSDADDRGGHTRYNWQLFEWRRSRHIALIRWKANVIEFVGPGGKAPFTGIHQLAAILAEYSRELPVPEPGPARPRHSRPPLRQCIERLKTQSDAYFGGGVRVADVAALAMLCPGESSGPSVELVTLSGDVLVRLVQLSPVCALQLENAGIDLYELVRIGSKLRDGLWRSPGSMLLKDLIDFNNKGPGFDEIRRRGELDETSLLIALLETARVLGTGANQLLQRLLRHQSGGDQPAEVARQLDQMCEQLVRNLQRRPARQEQLRWVIQKQEAKWTARPFGTAVVCNLAANNSEQTISMAVNVDLTDDAFAIVGVGEFEELLAAGPSPAAIDAFLAEHGDLAYLLGGTSTREAMVLAVGHDNQIFMEPLEDRAAAPAAVTGVFADDLSRAIAVLQKPGSPAPHDAAGTADWNGALVPIVAQHVILIDRGTPSRQVDTGTISMLELHNTVLAPLSRYSAIRRLGYDAFDV